MRSLVILIGTLLMGLVSYSQDNSVMVKLGSVQQIPMRNAKVFKAEDATTSWYVDYWAALFIVSETDSVFAFCKGKVVAVFELNNSVSVIMQDSADLFYTFTDLNKALVRKDDVLRRGSLVGLAGKNNENMRSLTLMINNKNGNQLIEEKCWELLNVHQCSERTSE